jgi:hypothetical protein
MEVLSGWEVVGAPFLVSRLSKHVVRRLKRLKSRIIPI